MRVESVMSRDVCTVTPETPLQEVARLLVERRISGLPVVEGDRVVGVVSEADILAKERGDRPRPHGLLGLLLDDRRELQAKLEAATAGESMSRPAITIGPDRSLAEAAVTMGDRQVNRLPVVDGQGRLVGIVTRADLVRAFVRSDEDIHRELAQEVAERTLWIDPAKLEIRVDRGRVTLVGEVETKADAQLLERFAAYVPGVISVRSDLRWQMEPRIPTSDPHVPRPPRRR